jgi:hypothetical protein
LNSNHVKLGKKRQVKKLPKKQAKRNSSFSR